MPSGYSSKPLSQKLGIKVDQVLQVINPPADYLDLLGPLPESVTIEAGAPVEVVAFVHVFVTRKEELAHTLPGLLELLAPKGMLWISWPKQAADVETDLTEDTLREIALPYGVVDTKVCAINEVWSGLKFVWRRGRKA